ncbi:50S ribosomal protein L11 methyltransferase [Litorimonas haliclonae]|uniref:50S ribosomal protein L11 methyltransferase n=1 Tax=Litorimonas haliclonae TaxID=2081977 RepID=UPI0039F0DCD1
MSLWKLELLTDEETAFEIAETLGFLDKSEAQSVSLFDQGEQKLVEAIYLTETEALTAQASCGGEVSAIIDKDWVSEVQSGLPAVRAGRFFVYGSHEKDNIPAEIKHPILIDAGMAFGTGHHGTTKGCLVIFDKLLLEGFTPAGVLDLGCGAGVLAIAAAKVLPEADILASDIDQDAVDVTLENARLNEAGEKLNVVQADGFETPSLLNKQFNLIFANILAGPLMGLAPDIYKAAAANGKVILSGILNEQAKSVSNAFEAAGFIIEPGTTLDEWTSLLAVKKS